MHGKVWIFTLAMSLCAAAGCHAPSHGSACPIGNCDTSQRRQRALDLNAKGVAFAESGDIDAAEEAFRGALRIDPSLAQAHNNIGYVLFTWRHSYHSAAVHLYQAIRLSPQSIEPRLGLARLYETVGMPTKSIAYYEDVLTIDPLHTEATGRLAQLRAEANERGCLRFSVGIESHVASDELFSGKIPRDTAGVERTIAK